MRLEGNYGRRVVRLAIERKNEQDESMETDEEEDLESELRKIYYMFHEQKGMNTPKRTDPPVIINTPTRQQKNRYQRLNMHGQNSNVSSQ